ncbi:hypothetical protein HY967_00570 [Candidatus Jorgensenbacteria bacterium]|nr:hypothetical protein [Candidatus Jorgensenbacteria bacterium]
MTYAEQELQPLGFHLLDTEADSVGFEKKVVLSFHHLKLQFDCVCPAYPRIKALGCPLHAHETSLPGSWPIEDAKKVATALK